VRGAEKDNAKRQTGRDRGASRRSRRGATAHRPVDVRLHPRPSSSLAGRRETARSGQNQQLAPRCRLEQSQQSAGPRRRCCSLGRDCRSRCRIGLTEGAGSSKRLAEVLGDFRPLADDRLRTLVAGKVGNFADARNRPRGGVADCGAARSLSSPAALRPTIGLATSQSPIARPDAAWPDRRTCLRRVCSRADPSFGSDGCPSRFALWVEVVARPQDRSSVYAEGSPASSWLARSLCNSGTEPACS
jgi:hypothetical protein